MNALIAYPENEEQLNALKAVMQAMKIAYEQTDENYPEHVTAGLKKSLNQAENGFLISFSGIKEMLNQA